MLHFELICTRPSLAFTATRLISLPLYHSRLHVVSKLKNESELCEMEIEALTAQVQHCFLNLLNQLIMTLS